MKPYGKRKTGHRFSQEVAAVCPCCCPFQFTKGQARQRGKEEIRTQVKDHESICDFYEHYKEVEGYYVEEDWWQWWRQHVA